MPTGHVRGAWEDQATGERRSAKAPSSRTAMSEASDRIQGRMVWTPPEGKTRFDAFRERVNKEHSLQLANYEDLYLSLIHI